MGRGEYFVKNRKSVKRLATAALSGIFLAGTIGASFSMYPVQAEKDTLTSVYSFEFDGGIGGWSCGDPGWYWQYNGTAPTAEADLDNDRMKITVDFSKDADKEWSNIAVCWWNDEGIDLSGVRQIAMDVWYESDKLTEGELKIAVYSNSGIDANSNLSDAQEERGTGMTKARVVIPCAEVRAGTVQDFAIKIVGCRTGYSGAVWIDHVEFLADRHKQTEAGVDSTIAANGGNPISSDGSTLTVTQKNGAKEPAGYASSVLITDPKATSETVSLYQYLEAMGKTDSVIYGHQNDTWHKAGNSALSDSDTYDVTGDYPGIVGMDTLSLTGNEYSAQRYNSEMSETESFQEIDTIGQTTAAANVEAAAKLANYNIANGSLITLSSHTPNFSVVAENPDYDPQSDPSYNKYDFTGYSPNTLTGDVMNELLPGGKYNAIYNAYLDMISDFAGQVNGPVMFRPFHEATGSWFWWGAAFCDPETYKSVYKYTVEYLRDVKGVHNFLYLYGPGSEAASEEEYGVRYPGDEYVDLIGFDMYDLDPVDAEEAVWLGNLKNQLRIVQNFAVEHHKLMAVTETGIACSAPDPGHKQTVLHEKGNKNLDWYNMVLDAVAESDAAYFLLWANFSKTDGYYTPYVDSLNEDGSLHGHETLDGFISFYNDNRSVFAGDQKGVLDRINTPVVQSPSNGIYGYITSPVAGDRVIEATELAARVSGASEGTQMIFVLRGKTEQTVKAEVKDSSVHAQLTQEMLKNLGEAADGTMELTANGKVIASIRLLYNIADAPKDPYEIDGFENYYGVDSMLNHNWVVNKAAGCTIHLALTDKEGKVPDGRYAMSLAYRENESGWAGATISKEVDWSDCDALEFYTIPDGNNQKVVVQLVANGKVYEVYLNEYEKYAENDGTVPIKVTIPFTDFVERDTAGNPAGGLVRDKTSITAFGLWVNAIPGSESIGEDGMVSGTIIYDQITAVAAKVTTAVFEEVRREGTETGKGTEEIDKEAEKKMEKTGAEDEGADNRGTAERRKEGPPRTESGKGGDDNGKSSNIGKIVRTGDNTNHMMYMATLFAAAALAVGVIVYRRKIR